MFHLLYGTYARVASLHQHGCLLGVLGGEVTSLDGFVEYLWASWLLRLN